MKFDVVSLRRADEDVQHITRWIASRSPQGANAWLDAYEHLLRRLSSNADSCAVAAENNECHLQVKQALFSTAHGQSYRAVFTLVGNEVRILRVRGPGQPSLEADELI